MAFIKHALSELQNGKQSQRTKCDVKLPRFHKGLVFDFGVYVFGVWIFLTFYPFPDPFRNHSGPVKAQLAK
jgi:hypothetical protein